jgi:DNA-binding GntR family transcriptional regulator
VKGAFAASTLDFGSYHEDCQGSHHEIADAFLRREGDRAAACLDQHLTLAKQKILALVSINKE